jgi:hypothetical protein
MEMDSNATQVSSPTKLEGTSSAASNSNDTIPFGATTFPNVIEMTIFFNDLTVMIVSNVATIATNEITFVTTNIEITLKFLTRPKKVDISSVAIPIISTTPKIVKLANVVEAIEIVEAVTMEE